MTKKELEQWQAVTNSSQYRWVEDRITRLNGRGTLYYTGGGDGCFMRITPEGNLTIGIYEVLYPICFQSITGYSFASLILAS